MSTVVRELRDRVVAEVGKVVVGQVTVIDALLIGVFARGHVLLEGVPGTAKTLLARSVSAALGLEFGRIQFTPDLMPSDILGTNIFDLKAGEFRLTKGPVFTELLLADEINRAPAKTQSALLEAMQERQVSLEGERHALSDHFTVLATQNPIEQEGTYPLPEAQLDRFLLKVRVGYPSAEEEDRILAAATLDVGTVDPATAGVRAVVSRQELEQIVVSASAVRVENSVRAYVRDLLRATRSTPMLMLGAGPRAGIHLLVASRWLAALDGRDFVTPDDVRSMLASVVCHRLVLAPETELDGMKPEDVLGRLVQAVPVPR
jgi:MoxR-like ATPase